MNWLLFALVSYLALVAETGLRAIWTVSLPIAGDLSPSLLLIVLVFVGLHASPWTVTWSALALGLVADLQPGPMPEATLLGPTALGFLAGAYAVVQMRAMVFRESLLTFVILVLLTGLFVHLVAVALLTLRGLPWPLGEPIPGWSAPDQLVHRFLELMYTAALAVPAGLVLFRTTRLWAFAGKGKK
jgi:cell shape-determining protein MreD